MFIDAVSLATYLVHGQVLLYIQDGYGKVHHK